ncbi:uncharacterized protein LOC129753257 [Uranotaenia lowii]|uniref:uncharacterized protein LOC129753257 n=1 Tax=Uranotaenia lowii TaxID=190385 RepID=UPI002478B0CA|nr:uncharacterized protein LOC129753257 [Uranotaenia lowii]
MIHEGIPQGSVIAPTLFLVAMQNIFNIIPENTQTLIFADDIILIAKSSFAKLTRKKLQNAVEALSKWAPEVGFSFSAEKSKLLHFGPNRKRLSRLPPLLLDGNNIGLVHSARILGVIVDDKLNFIGHANRVRKNCTNKLNILKILSQNCGSASRPILQRFLRAWLLPSILYGVGLFSRGGDKVTKILEPAYNQGVRTISAAFQSSPIISLMAESGLQPFENVITQALTAKTIRWLSYNRPSNAPMVVRTRDSLQQLFSIALPNICVRSDPRLRPWNCKKPKIDLSLLKIIRAGQPSQNVLPKFLEHQTRLYASYNKVFTDGSKSLKGQVGYGIYNENKREGLPLPSACSVYSAEAFALKIALENYCTINQPTVIFSDSASVLTAAAANNDTHPWVAEISKQAVSKNVILCWVPGHCGISGNEAADRLAFEGSQSSPPISPIPHTDAIRTIKNQIWASWENTWNQSHTVKLREIKNTPCSWIDQKMFEDRRALTRLRIGHTRLTHGFLMAREPAPVCHACNTIVTVKHILVDCLCYQQQRKNFGLSTSLRTILSNCPKEERKVLLFMKKTKLLQEL